MEKGEMRRKWAAFWQKVWTGFKSFIQTLIAFVVWIFEITLEAIVAVGRAFWNLLFKSADRIKSGWAGFKKNPFFVKEYGDSLMTEKTWSTIKVFTWVISIQFAIDFVAWGRVGSYGFPKETMGSFIHYGAMVFVGLALGLAILLFDRTVITLDTSKSRTQLWPLFGRGIILIAISFVTAVPVELTLYEPAITRRLEAKQKQAVDAIRTRAIAEEQAAFDRKVASAQDDLTKISEGYTLLKKRVAEYQDERATMRKQVEDQRAAGAVLLQKSIDEQRKAVNEEMDGTGGSGHRGRARIADYKEALLAKLVGDKRQFDAETVSVLARFDAETAAGVKEREAALTQKSKDDESVGKVRLEELRAEKDKKIDSLRLMPAGVLSQKYGGDWKNSFDFLTRYRELSIMSKEDPIVRWSVWGCRLVLIAIGLLILFLKAMAPDEFKRYYSFHAQIAYGQRPDVVEQGVVAGYTDKKARQALGFSREVCRLLEALGTARRRLAEAYARFCQQVQTLAAQVGNAGLHRPLSDLRSTARQLWFQNLKPNGVPFRKKWPAGGASVMQCILELERAEEQCRLNGLSLPPWPESELGKDPRAFPEPWNISEGDAILYGWSDPESARLANLADKLADARHKLAQAYAYFRSNMMYWCQERNPKDAPAMTLPKLYLALAEQWRQGVMPTILHLEMVEHECHNAGLDMPFWPAELGSDPRTLTKPWQPSPDELVRYGWTDPVPAAADISKAKAEIYKLRALVESRIESTNHVLAYDLVEHPHQAQLDFFKKYGAERLDIWRTEIRVWMYKLAEAERILRTAGEDVPPWDLKPGIDPGPNGWLITDSLLAILGWISPPPLAELAREKFRNLCARMDRVVEQLNLKLAIFIRTNPGISADDVRAQLETERYQAWAGTILPLMSEVADATHVIVSADGAPPVWTPDFNPGPLGWQLDMDLLIRYGWTEPLPPPPPPAPTDTPPPPAAEPLPSEPPADPPPSAPPADPDDPSHSGT